MLNKLNNILKEDEIWFLFNNDGNDPYFTRYISDKSVVNSYAICTNKDIYVFVNELDYDNFNDITNVIKYSNMNELKKEIENVISILDYPSKVFLNYSDTVRSNVDILGHGAYKYITKLLRSIYGSNIIKFMSAEYIIYSLAEIKSDEEIKYMKIAANRALYILEESFRNIKVGMSEIEIANIVHDIFNIKPDYFKEYNIIDEKYAWNINSCPVVLTGDNLLKGGHAMASEKILNRGDTIYFDFGVTLVLSDGRKFSSDIQRMGYALKEYEKDVPDDVKKVFDTLVRSIEIGIKNCKPGVKGYIIDQKVRGYIVDNNYPSYNHATGHPVGEEAHDLGTLLSPKGGKLSALTLKENGVYTIEPRIQIKNGGSIEEMILVTKDGGIPLCKKQDNIYLV